MTDKLVVFCMCASAEEAARLARMLVERELARCVNIVPAVQSIYRWQGKIEETSECMLLIKTSRAKFEELSGALSAAHSYDVPEILAVPVAAGARAYLDWLDSNE